MIGHRHRDSRTRNLFLHDDMAATVSDLSKAMVRKDATDLTTREDPELTQRQPPHGSQTPRCGVGFELRTDQPFQRTIQWLRSNSVVLPRPSCLDWQYRVQGRARHSLFLHVR